MDPWLVPHPGGGPAGESVPGGWRLDGLGQPQPPEDNGIKLFGPSGAKLSRDQQQAIEAGLRGEVRPALTSCGPTQRRTELLESYTALLEKAWKVGALMVAGSCLISAGVQPPPARVPVSASWCEVIALHSQPDGAAINVGCGSTHLEPCARP